MPEKKFSFVDLVHIEQLRNIEANKGEELSYASVAGVNHHANVNFEYATFVQQLSTRAQCLIKDNSLTEALLRPQKLFARTGYYSMIIAAVLGAIAASHAIGESDTLNIYWLLVVLLGFNLLSIALWIIGIVFNLQGLSTGVVAQLANWLPYRNKENSKTFISFAARAWWESCLTGRVGKWRMSVLTHKLWLTYLLAGIIALILLMTARQYNFIWGTTLLSENTLPKFTQLMSIPMEYLGLMAPDSNQIAISRIGAGDQDTETRGAWARFLLGALLFYGLLPRALLLVFSLLMQKWAEMSFKLDLFLPYFIELRQYLMSPQIETQVIDADPQEPQEPSIEEPLPVIKAAPLTNTQAVGIELDDHTVWPSKIICHKNIVDQASLMDALKIVKNITGSSLLIGVVVNRLPDRGIQRIVEELIAGTKKESWLILLNKSSSMQPATDARKHAWFRLAEACKISAEHVITQ